MIRGRRRIRSRLAVGVLAALLAMPVDAAFASHDASTPVVFKLKKRVRSLTAALAHQGIRNRLAAHSFRTREYRGRCRRRSRLRLRCTYRFRDRAQIELGAGAYCSSRRGTLVRLVRRGRAVRVGATPTRAC